MPKHKFKSGAEWDGNRQGPSTKKVSIAHLARGHAPSVISRLKFWLDQSEYPNASIRAAEILLDRAFGKAVQPIADGSNHEALELDLSNVPYQELMRYEKTMMKLLARTSQIQDAIIDVDPATEATNATEVSVIDPTKFDGSA